MAIASDGASQSGSCPSQPGNTEKHECPQILVRCMGSGTSILRPDDWSIRIGGGDTCTSGTESPGGRDPGSGWKDMVGEEKEITWSAK
jgi:hypothetical protein